VTESYLDGLLFRIGVASVAACTCKTASPDHEAHIRVCRYRVLIECEQQIARLRGLEK
jgi:hypothetical protein